MIAKNIARDLLAVYALSCVLFLTGSLAEPTSAATKVTVTPTPVITSITPTAGPANTVITIKGTGFTPTQNYMQIGAVGVNNLVSTLNGTVITVAVPPNTALYNTPTSVFITNSYGNKSVQSNYARFTMYTPPTVTLTAASSTVVSGSSTVLSYSATGVTACTSNTIGGIAATGFMASGTFSSGALTATKTFSIVCTGPLGNATATTTVTIAPAQKISPAVIGATAGVNLPPQYVVGPSSVSIGSFILRASQGAATITELRLSSQGYQSPVQSLTINVSGQSYMALQVSGTTTFSGLNIPIPANGSVTINVTATYAPVDAINGISSGYSSRVNLGYIKAVNSVGAVTETYTAVSLGSMTTVGSKPSLSITNPGTTLSAGVTEIARVTVSADVAGQINVNALPLTIQSTGYATAYGQMGNATSSILRVTNASGSVISTATSSILYVSAGAKGSLVIYFGSGYPISKGTSETFRIFATTGKSGSASAGDSSLITSLGASSEFKWTDVKGNTSGLDGLLIPSSGYPVTPVTIVSAIPTQSLFAYIGSAFASFTANVADGFSYLVEDLTAAAGTAVNPTPTVSVAGTPTMTMKYDSNSNESRLDATAVVAVTAGSVDATVPKSNGIMLSLTKVVPFKEYFISPSRTLTTNSAGAYVVPAGTTARFAVTQTMNPKLLAPGSYAVSQIIVNISGGHDILSKLSSAVIVKGTSVASISVVSPRAGEEYLRGASYPVSWNQNKYTGKVRVILSNNTTGAQYPVLSTTQLATYNQTTGIYSASMVIPATMPVGDKYRIIVMSASGAFFDYSDYFSITKTETPAPTATTNSTTATIIPTITSISPTSGPLGTQVVVTGTGFTLGGNRVSVGNRTTNIVASTQDGTKITFPILINAPAVNTPSVISVTNSFGKKSVETNVLFTLTGTTPVAPPAAITICGDNQTLTNGVCVTNVTQPTFTTTPNPISFGTVTVGQTATQSITIKNTGTVNGSVDLVVNVSGGGTDFSIPGSSLYDLALTPGSQANVVVTFRPSTDGSRTGSIRLFETGTDHQYGSAITLSGTGVAIPAGPVISPTAIVPTLTFNTAQTSIVSGTATTLTWSSTNATSCTGTNFNTNGATSGSVSTGNLTDYSTHYSITCTNGTGLSAMANLYVGTTAPITCSYGYTYINGVCTLSQSQNLASPTATITFDTASVVSGDRVKLSWSSTNASYCRSNDFSTLDGANNGQSGFIYVVPAETRTYSITCTGETGLSGSDIETVTVIPRNIASLTLTVDNSTVLQNGYTTVRWSANRGTYCYGLNQSGTLPAEGSLNVGPLVTSMRYVLNCATLDGTIIKWLDVTVKQLPAVPRGVIASTGACDVAQTPKVNVSWSLNPGVLSTFDPATSYKIYRAPATVSPTGTTVRPDESAYVLVGTTAGPFSTTGTFTDSSAGLVPGKYYYYTITGVNDAGESAKSMTVEQPAYAIPSCALNMIVSVVGPDGTPASVPTGINSVYLVSSTYAGGAVALDPTTKSKSFTGLATGAIYGVGVPQYTGYRVQQYTCSYAVGGTDVCTPSFTSSPYLYPTNTYQYYPYAQLTALSRVLVGTQPAVYAGQTTKVVFKYVLGI